MIHNDNLKINNIISSVSNNLDNLTPIFNKDFNEEENLINHPHNHNILDLKERLKNQNMLCKTLISNCLKN